MSKDYAHRQRNDYENNWRNDNNNKRKKNFLRKIIIVIGIIGLSASIFFAVIYIKNKFTYSKNRSSSTQLKIIKAPVKSVKISTPVAAKMSPKEISNANVNNANDPLAAKINYTFYNSLPNMSANTIVDNNETQKKVAMNHQYMLQLASFYNQAQAQALIERLKKLQFNATIKIFKRGDNNIYRVQMGPFKSIITARNIQDDLQVAQIPSLMLAQK